MAYYRLYFVKGGHFNGFEDFEAEDDVRAVAVAAPYAGALALELWCGRRRVKTFAALEDALAGSAANENPAAARG